MILGLGLDLEHIESVKQKRALQNSRAFFHASELIYAREKLESFAGIICAKESFVKAASTLPGCPRYSFKDIELQHCSNGKPLLRLYGDLAMYFEHNGFHAEVSITHTKDLASAIVAVYGERS